MEKIIDGIEYVITVYGPNSIAASVQDVVVTQDNKKREITIPAMVEGATVVGISENAFQDAYWLEKINLPHTIGIIGAGAFDNCKLLREVSIDGKMTSLFVYRNAFSRCYKLEKISMAEGGYICLKGPGIFKDCELLKELPPIMNGVPAHTFLRSGLRHIIILGDVFLDSEVFRFSNIEKIACENLEGIDGNIELFKNIQIITSELTETVEYLVYNGYPVSVIDYYST